MRPRARPSTPGRRAAPTSRGLRLTWLAAGEDVESAAAWRLDCYVHPDPREPARAPERLARDLAASRSPARHAGREVHQLLRGDPGRASREEGRGGRGPLPRARRALPRGDDDGTRGVERRHARPRAGGRPAERDRRGVLRGTGRRGADRRGAPARGSRPPRLAHDRGAPPLARRPGLRAAAGDARAHRAPSRRS